jgi:hypothetical protein
MQYCSDMYYVWLIDWMNVIMKDIMETIDDICGIYTMNEVWSYNYVMLAFTAIWCCFRSSRDNL